MKRNLSLMMALLLTAVLCLGCLSSAGAEEAGEKFLIGFSTKTLTNEPFQALVYETVEKKVKEAGHDVILMSTDTVTNAAMQVNQLEDLLNQGVEALILVTVDNTGAIEVLKQYKEKNIPVVLIDNILEEGNEELYISFVGTDNYEAGYMVGQQAVKDLPEGGKLIVTRSPAAIVPCELRTEGFLAAIKDSGIELLGEQACDATNEGCMKTTENLLTAHPDANVFFCPADVWLDGAVEALIGAGKDDAYVYSVDGSRGALDQMKAQTVKVSALAQQSPVLMAELAVDIVLQVLSGEKTPEDFDKTIVADCKLVTLDNLEEAYETTF